MSELTQLKKLMESIPISEDNDPVQHIHDMATRVAVEIRKIAKEADSSSNRALFGDMVEELSKDFLEALELELNMVLRK